MKVCIDTNAYRYFLEKENGVLEMLEKADIIFVPAIVVGELFAGFRIGKRYAYNNRVFADFLSEVNVEVVDVTYDIAQRYGEIVAQLKKNGTPIPTNDIWVAATVLETGSRLITYDKHFKNVPGLYIVSL